MDMEKNVAEIGFSIIFVGIFIMFLLLLLPQKYTLTKGAQASSISQIINIIHAPRHMLTRNANILRFLSFALLISGLLFMFSFSA
jgi:uncharacterized membrane protein